MSVITFYRTIVNQPQHKVKHIKRSLRELSESDRSWFEQQTPEHWQLAHDGLQLQALFLKQEQAKGVVIAAHGYHHSYEQMIPYARMFMQLGYSVLLPDARAHGRSEGKYIGFGWSDRLDYQLWIDQVEKTAPGEVILFGISMGAATVLATAGEGVPTVKAVIADSSFENVYEEVAHRVRTYYHLPSIPLVPISSLLNRLLNGYWFKKADIKGQVARIQQPTLLIHGGSDTYVPVIHGKNLFATLPHSAKELHIFPEAEHIKSFATDAEQYQVLVEQFLSEC